MISKVHASPNPICLSYVAIRYIGLDVGYRYRWYLLRLVYNYDVYIIRIIMIHIYQCDLRVHLHLLIFLY